MKSKLPKLRSQIREELRGKGLNDELANLVLYSGRLDEFQELLEVFNKPELIAKLLVLWPSEIESKLKIKNKLTIDIAETILQAIESKKIYENDAKNVLSEYLEGKSIEEALKIEKVKNLEEEILKIVREKPGLGKNAYVGLIMAKFKGKVNGKEVMEILDRLVK
jgi:Glu-tRNA(Gln) amidotransferase subunit E-like FAD-binding protein